MHTFTADEPVTWSLAGGADQSRFSINSSSGTLSFVSAPDFENPADSGADNVYEVLVRATDGTGNISEQMLMVTVDDVDESGPPVITGPSGGAGASSSATAIDENTTDVTTFTASETVTWSIVGGADQGAFSINSSTGALTFNSAPDFETPTDTGANNTYEVQVQATDADTNTSTQTLTVTISDVDESGPPVITGPSGAPGSANSSTSIDENTTAVTTFTASETVTWGIVGGADQAAFSINTSTGVLTFNSPPDFENPTDNGSNNTYVVAVQATDSSTDTSIQTLTVTVNDVDDTPPVITGPSGGAGAASSSTSIDENTTAVTTFTANEGVTWSLVGGPDQSAFNINSSGALTFSSAPDFENPTDTGTNNTYQVQVRATDGSGNTSDQTITVTVNDVDDTPPVITGPSGGPGADNSSTSIDENTTAVTTFTADENVTWGLVPVDDWGAFIIDSVSGELTFKSPPDFEAPTDAGADNTYNVQVRATDSSGNTSDQALAVSVNDIADTLLPDPTIVVFDLVEGISSDHSGRKFDKDTSYTIYVRVDSDSNVLATDGQHANPALIGESWGVWSGGKDLGV